MAKLARDRLFRTWAILVAVTMISSGIGGAAVTYAVLGMAFAKCWLVMFEFMELRGAPVWLRLAATLWLLAALAGLLAIYAGAFAAAAAPH